MALRTQVDPYVLIGDTLDDLPLPDAVAQGTLFHAVVTGDCRILVIEVTGHRFWDVFCGGSGGSGSTGATGPAGFVAYKFAGGAIAVAGGPFNGYIADDVAEDMVGDIVDTRSVQPLQYPVVAPATTAALSLFVRANSLTRPSSAVLVRNGTDPVVTVPIPAGFTGPLTGLAAAAFVAGDQVDVELVLDPNEVVSPVNALALTAIAQLSA